MDNSHLREIARLSPNIRDLVLDMTKSDPRNLIKLTNAGLVHVAELIVRSATKRRESRGLHFNLDYPELDDPPQDTIMFPGSIDHLDMLRPSA